ncbi:MAG: hypothetical protein LR008_01245 [Candidatus Pacebacteria bacterium]|nr:hypothetical protein [Candidatus Paceibacterota bacterium]
MSALTARLLLLTILLFPDSSLAGFVPQEYTQANFDSSYQDQPVHFTRDASGNFSGTTMSGKMFTQTYVAASISVRLQKFSIDKASFYISSYGIINAASDIEALSIYLVKARWGESELLT